MKVTRTKEFWFLFITSLIILAWLFIGQMMAFVNYGFTVSIGLQEPVHVIGEMGVAVNKGFGVGDTAAYIPLMIFGLIGLMARKRWSLIIMGAAFGITVYWPVTCMFILLFARGTPGYSFTSFGSYTVVLSIITLYGIWGIWYLIRDLRLLAGEKNIEEQGEVK
jgi:hypothetical protein